MNSAYTNPNIFYGKTNHAFSFFYKHGLFLTCRLVLRIFTEVAVADCLAKVSRIFGKLYIHEMVKFLFPLIKTFFCDIDFSFVKFG